MLHHHPVSLQVLVLRPHAEKWAVIPVLEEAETGKRPGLAASQPGPLGQFLVSERRCLKKCSGSLERWLGSYEHLLFLWITWVLFPAPIWGSTVCNSSSRGSIALFWMSQVLQAPGALTNVIATFFPP